ncbi:retrotransposon protein, putative, unclassified [Cucumis melo var. makuwa]|uniref:Retrotransposon protein, putative, unclassified n=1 Tax=Cucumis melo var. makuwa TaxID=1194695 RepID=A0A5D3DB88_CUCMM|nr:retrotransposon protein, putative, unclassified [Cucumis melo var. makuwa]TYK20887.1 retrotransposon protein, putative, unclassified [Cucumis melo var. makuwa]
MRKVLSVLRERELYANKKKCSFAQQTVEYLGHSISEEGVEVDPEKIKSITKWPKPTNIKEVRGFLGLTGYYRRFVQNYGAIAAPLTQLLKKGGYKWSAEAEDAFERLKKAMSSLPVLALPDFSQPFEIETNASGYSVGAILIQAKRPIAYYSRTLALRDRARPVYKRALMVVVLAVQHWRPYLLGGKFKAMKIAADALSRIPAEIELRGLFVPMTVDFELIKKEVHQDLKLQKLITELRELKDQQDSKYSLQNDVLKYKDRLSKYGHFLPLKHPFTAKVVAKLFIKEVVRLHGFPLSIVSDRDKIFPSHFWQELFRVSAYHPQTDGQTEVVNRGVETYLKCFCNEKPKEWVKWLPWTEYWYNTTFQRAIGMSLFQVVYGRKPPALLSYGSMQSKNSTVEEMLQERDEILSALRDHLHLAQEQMKDYAVRERRHVEYCVGDCLSKDTPL